MQESAGKEVSVIAPERKNRLDLPAAIRSAGPAAGFAWEEFFLGKIRNRYTRTAYLRAVRRVLEWSSSVEPELTRITPGMVGQYFDELRLSVPSKKLHLSAIRTFFDVLVQRHVVVLNPALSVKTERYSAVEGRTPEISVEQSRRLLASIRLASAIDYRDRAVIAVLIYTAAREGAVAGLRLRDLEHDGTQYALRFLEKGGKARLIPVRHDLQTYVQEYLAVGGLHGEEGCSVVPHHRRRRKIALGPAYERRRHLPDGQTAAQDGGITDEHFAAFVPQLYGDRPADAGRCAR
jgi:site-specific recombinase XerC